MANMNQDMVEQLRKHNERIMQHFAKGFPTETFYRQIGKINKKILE